MRAYILWLSLSVVALSGCGGATNGESAIGNGESGGLSALQVVTPKIIYAKATENELGYVVIKNPTNTAVSNLHYSLSEMIGGASGTIIDPISAENCAVVPANSQCNVKVIVPAGAVAGSVGFNVGGDSSGVIGRLINTVNSSMIPTQTIGIEQAVYNDLPEANGITINYFHTVINGVPYILVSGLVASANAGTFDNIILVDAAGNPLPNQELINGGVNYTLGSTFSILLPVPLGNNLSQTIKVQTLLGDKIISTASMGSTMSTAEDVGIVNTLPSNVYLTESSFEQTITFSNTGEEVQILRV